MILEHGGDGGQAPANDATEPEDSEVTAAVSHELNTPLAVITGYAELLAVRDDDHTRREAAVRIQEAADMLRSAIDDTLVLFRDDAGDLGRRFLKLRRASRTKRSTSS